MIGKHRANTKKARKWSDISFRQNRLNSDLFCVSWAKLELCSPEFPFHYASGLSQTIRNFGFRFQDGEWSNAVAITLWTSLLEVMRDEYRGVRGSGCFLSSPVLCPVLLLDCQSCWQKATLSQPQDSSLLTHRGRTNEEPVTFYRLPHHPLEDVLQKLT